MTPLLATDVPTRLVHLSPIDIVIVQTFERYPNSIGVVRDGCIALLRATPIGLQMVGAPGWRTGEVLGVLVEKDGRQVFQAKAEIVEATPERLEALRRVRGG